MPKLNSFHFMLICIAILIALTALYGYYRTMENPPVDNEAAALSELKKQNALRMATPQQILDASVLNLIQDKPIARKENRHGK